MARYAHPMLEALYDALPDQHKASLAYYLDQLESEFTPHAAILAAFADYEAPNLASDEEGFMVEMALQHEFQMVNDDGTAFACNQEQLLAFTKANRAPGVADKQRLGAALAAAQAVVDALNNLPAQWFPLPGQLRAAGDLCVAVRGSK